MATLQDEAQKHFQTAAFFGEIGKETADKKLAKDCQRASTYHAQKSFFFNRLWQRVQDYLERKQAAADRHIARQYDAEYHATDRRTGEVFAVTVAGPWSERRREQRAKRKARARRKARKGWA